MSNTRLVVTLWDGKHEHFHEMCKASVKESRVDHLVVRAGDDWQVVLHSLRNEADLIAWVDADDIVYPGAINKALDLLESTNAGLVYTDEAMIDGNGTILQESGPKARTLFDLASHPNAVHHLHCTRKYAISNRPLDIHFRLGAMVDWSMKVDAAANAGMAHIPEVGYGWRLHGEQITSKPGFQREYQAKIQPIRQELRSWVCTTLNGIPVKPAQ